MFFFFLYLFEDLNVACEKMNALKAEHRDLKCTWLSEKGELESRCFQLQALHTQLQGSLRKKEKDYDRLQVSYYCFIKIIIIRLNSQKFLKKLKNHKKLYHLYQSLNHYKEILVRYQQNLELSLMLK